MGFRSFGLCQCRSAISLAEQNRCPRIGLCTPCLQKADASRQRIDSALFSPSLLQEAAATSEEDSDFVRYKIRSRRDSDPTTALTKAIEDLLKKKLKELVEDPAIYIGVSVHRCTLAVYRFIGFSAQAGPCPFISLSAHRRRPPELCPFIGLSFFSFYWPRPPEPYPIIGVSVYRYFGAGPKSQSRQCHHVLCIYKLCTYIKET